MKKSLIVSVIASLSIVCLTTGVANAWHYGITGSGVCQPDGTYKITWKVDNTSEPSALDVYESSYPQVIPTGNGIVGAHKAKEFTHSVDGIKPASYTMKLKADWNGDRSKQIQSATVTLSQPCQQPENPEEQGRGAGEVLGAETKQVSVAPVGAVNAGEGANSTNYLMAASGILMSVAAIAYGIVSLIKARG